MPSSAVRLGLAAVLLAAGLAGAGFIREYAHFGSGPDATAQNLESDVRQRFAFRARRVEWLGRRLADEAELIGQAATSVESVPALFSALIALARQTTLSSPDAVSATVYVPSGPAGGYRVLAWSDGPAEDVPSDRLTGEARLFVAPGPLGPLLSFAQPVEREGRRIGMAVAQTALSRPAGPGVAEGAYALESAYGPVAVSQLFADVPDAPRPGVFVISDGGQSLLEVQFDAAALAVRRARFRRTTLAVAALPLVALISLAIAAALNRRARAVSLRLFDAWSIIAAGLVTAAATALVLLGRSAGVPAGLDASLTGLAAIALAYLFPVSWWWRRGPRLFPRSHPVQFAFEHAAGGAAVMLALLLATRFAAAGVLPAPIALRVTQAFSTNPVGFLASCGPLLAQLAVGWAIAGLLAYLSARWRLTWRYPLTGGVAAFLWLLPTALLLAVPVVPEPLPALGLASAAGLGATFALFSTSFRRYYRQTTQAARLVLLFAAMVLPPAAMYPLTAFTADRQARSTIETDYARATAALPERLQAQLALAQREIDAFPTLVDLVRAAPPVGQAVQSRLAYLVWNTTNLSRSRVTSEVELYDSGRALVSRFGLNVPEYQVPGTGDEFRTPSCQWQVYSEVKRFGADDRLMWHAERSICDETGVRGAVAVHVVPDYEALPFISSGDPYREVLGAAGDNAGVRVDDLAVVIYGWGRTPVFTSGTAAWPMPDALFQRLRSSREPFWTALPADDRMLHVYFTNDRAFIYAFAYPRPTWFEHAARLAEITSIMAALFLLWLVSAMVYAPLRPHHEAPLRVLFHEIRTSFYRKLYLFFVLAAIGPVMLLSLGFGAYMSSRLEAGVEAEAAHVVSVARRVFQELAAAEQYSEQGQAPPGDDAMVWIRQVVSQDVNLFRGPRLLSTSQRDLFDSGLLPTRTPATMYRSIALDRLPSYVGRDRIGAFDYLIAAAPIPAVGQDVVLSVPMALQQRDIERELARFNRGVLVAAVVVVLFAAGLGASVAGRVSDPVARLTRATRQIAAGQLDVRIVADTADELKRLVDDFNAMTATLVAQRDELARTNQLKAWAEMARQVAHEIKNPLTPIQLAAEHLERVHSDRGRPLGPVFDQCVTTILRQVRLLRQIASEFSNFAGTPTARPEPVSLAILVDEIVEGYRASPNVRVEVDVPADLPAAWVDRTLVARALTNIVENAVQAMPDGGRLSIRGGRSARGLSLVVEDTGVGMEAVAAARAFEPYFSTKTAGSGLGLPNAKRNVELCGGTLTLSSEPGRGTTVAMDLPGGPVGPVESAAG